MQLLSFRERFYARVSPTPCCWLWTGYIGKDGYGFFSVNRSPVGAHRVAYQLEIAPIPPQWHVCHRCDLPRCVNPAHLFLGTVQHNIADRDAKRFAHKCACRTLVLSPHKQLSSVEKFWAQVSKQPDSCWTWTGQISTKGYGQIWHQGHMWFAHRLSYLWHYGALPESLFVLHHCDIRSCVNPAHLFLGTADDNMKDKVRKGRQPRGQQHGKAKLTDEQVRHILSLQGTMSSRVVAHMYNVTQANICFIWRGVTWTHLARTST